MIHKKLLKFGLLIFVGIFLIIVVFLKLAGQRKSRIRALGEPTVGYPYFISSQLYGTTPEEEAAMKAAAEGDSTQVQNIQPPGISGFSTDLFTGNSTVVYPLDIPPGRGGLTPSISLIYSSSSVYAPVLGANLDGSSHHDEGDVTAWKNKLYFQSSQLGLGWELGGLSNIFRDSTGQYTLILNGRSYRLFKSTEEKDWHTNPTSFLNISHIINWNDEFEKNTTPKDTPENFEITDTNGTIYTFEPRGYFWRRCEKRSESGHGACQQATAEECNNWGKCPGGDCTECEKWARYFTKWVLTKVKDVHSNEINILYTKEMGRYTASSKLNNEPYPRAIYPFEINYSNGTTKIEFEPFHPVDDQHGNEYVIDDPAFVGNRDDTEGENWNGTQSFFSKQRLEKINVLVKQGSDWKIVRQYELSNNQYFTKPDDAAKKLHLKLTNITSRSRDDNNDDLGDQTLPAYTFTYYDDANDDNNFRLLKTANNGYGGKVEYLYQKYNVTDYYAKTGGFIGTVYGAHRLTQKKAFDELTQNFFKTAYDYPLNSDSGVGVAEYQHSDFELVGHSRVAEKIFKKNSEADVLKTTVYEFIQGPFIDNHFYVKPERGQLMLAAVFDGNFDAGTPENPNIDLNRSLSFSQTDYLREPNDDPETDNDPGTNYANSQDTIWNTGHFIAAKEIRSCQEPISQWPMGNKTRYYYRPEDQNGQQWGNLTQTTEYLVNNCDFSSATAYRSTHSTYFPNLNSHITNRVAETEIFACETDSSTGDCIKTKRLALSWNIYDDQNNTHGNNPKQKPENKGLLTLSRAFYKFPEEVDATIDNRDTVDAKYEYYDFGNLKTTTTYDGYGQSLSATSGSGTARTSTIEYDMIYNTFPVLTKNPLEHVAKTYYRKNETDVNHPYLADRTVTQDVNGQLWTNVVDGFGRTKETYVPGESAVQTKVDYNDVDKTTTVNPFIVHTQTRDDNGKDENKDGVPDNLSYYNSWQFYNGLGQVIETQVEKEGDGAKIALTATSYNTLGQAEKTLLPYEAASGGAFIQPDFNRPERTEADYDSLGRVKESRTPSKIRDQWYKTQSKYYGRKTAVLDPKNHLAVSEVDNLGRTLEALAFNKQVNGLPEDGSQLPTDYYVKTRIDEYDHLDRVKKTTTTDRGGTSSKTAISEVSYNQFGQKMSSKDPDLGNWSYYYNATGTLLAVKDAKTKIGSFEYDKLGRMTKKYVDNTLQPDGTVLHGTLAASFNYDNNCTYGIGRLCSDSTKNQDINTSTDYIYDAKGRLQSETKTIDGTSYTTTFAYDAAGRQREITYPDGEHEKVNYSYNDAGLLNNVAGAETYLSSAKYNVLGLREEEVLGNNQTKNSYIYEPQTYRLASKTVKSLAQNKDLWSQNLGYDPVGNIEEITYPLNKDPMLPKPYKIDYTYDELNRLTEGKVVGLVSDYQKSGDQFFYTKYSYDELGRMNLKQEEGKEPCGKSIVYDINVNSALVAENLSGTEGGYITFDFYNNAGKELFFVGDGVKPKNDSTEPAKKSFVPILVDALSDIRSRYPNFEGFVVVESHKKTDYAGKADGPCITVLSGTAEELCQINPERYSSFCGEQ